MPVWAEAADRNARDRITERSQLFVALEECARIPAVPGPVWSDQLPDFVTSV
jgi:hypothetical protein